LLAADILTVTAVLLVYFFAPRAQETTTAALAAITASGLFVFIPVLLDSLRAKKDNAVARALLETLRTDIAESQRILQSDLLALAQRLASFEKSAAAHAAANPPVPPAQLASQLATALNSENNTTFSRLSATVDSFQNRLDAFGETLRSIENTVRANAAAVETLASRESDGSSPRTLLARAFPAAHSAGNSAVARLIGNAAISQEPGSHAASHNPLSPSEDEVWNTATDMADAESNEPQPAPAPAEPEPPPAEPQPAPAAPPPAPPPEAQGELDLRLPPPTSPAPRKRTILIANLITGLADKPYVRGIGAGLNEDIGVPMVPVGIGRWQWVCPDPSQPVQITIWKNDIHRADGAPISIGAGRTVETSPRFSF
jgi:hypothetical protein